MHARNVAAVCGSSGGGIGDEKGKQGNAVESSTGGVEGERRRVEK